MILLAGGTGTLGREVQRRLRARGHPFRVLTRSARPGGDADVVRGDVRDPASLVGALEGVDTVISAVTGFGLGGGGPQAVDLAGNRALIEAAQAAGGVRRFVHLSVFGASAEHPLELYRAKHAAEGLVRATGIDWTIVRPTPFIETFVTLIGSSVRDRGSALIFGAGRNPVNFVSVRDVAFVVERAIAGAELAHRAVDVGGPENITMSALVDAIGRSAGRGVRVRHIPRPVLRMAAAAARLAKPDVARLIETAILMDTADMTYDDSELRRLFCDVPRTAVSDVIADMPAA